MGTRGGKPDNAYSINASNCGHQMNSIIGRIQDLSLRPVSGRIATAAFALTLLFTEGNAFSEVSEAINAIEPETANESPITTTCAGLMELNLPKTKIMKAEKVEAGAFPAPSLWRPSPADAEIYKRLPVFCRIVAQLAPSPDSDMRIELWLPLNGWNGKFRGQGNGGFAGKFDYDSLAFAVSQGYASAATDTGHAGSDSDATWALNHPEKVIDFGYRAIHEMTQRSRSIIKAFYGSSAKRSYFASCSDGGREALMEAQRYPEDYDGILAGAPAFNWTKLLTNAVHNEQVLTLDPASSIPPAKLPAISAAVLSMCDAADGVSDGILNDPRQCHFDPSSML
jgi:hypothetical protein